MLFNIYGYFESKCFGQNASLLKLEEKSKLNHSFCITFIGLSFSCFDARSNFWQGCSLKRSLVKTFTLKYCNVYSFNQHLHSQYQGELCPYLVVFTGWQSLSVVPTSVAREPTNQSSVDDSAPQFLNKESVSKNRSQYSRSMAKANPFYSLYTAGWLSYTVISK